MLTPPAVDLLVKLGLAGMARAFPELQANKSAADLGQRFFRDLTEDAVREGSFASVAALVDAIKAYLAERNLAPKRYVWKAQGHDILMKINRARAALGFAQYIWVDFCETLH